jgi:uncharacterized membrane protein
MRPIEVTRHAAAPPAIVWAVATDLEHLPETVRGIDQVEILTDPPFEVGTRWRETRTMGGRAATEEMWVCALEPGQSYLVEAASHGMRYRSEFRFAPDGDGTAITLRFDAEPTGAATRVLAAVTARAMAGGVRKALTADLHDLAAAAEARNAE